MLGTQLWDTGSYAFPLCKPRRQDREPHCHVHCSPVEVTLLKLYVFIPFNMFGSRRVLLGWSLWRSIMSICSSHADISWRHMLDVFPKHIDLKPHTFQKLVLQPKGVRLMPVLRQSFSHITLLESTFAANMSAALLTPVVSIVI